MGGRRRRPSNAPGAHYLADPKLASRLVDAGRVRHGDLVLDLGAGTGALTAALVRAGARVVAVERDARLASRLRGRFAHANVTVLEADLLDFPLPKRPYRVVASIPFGITTPLLGRLLDSPRSPLQRAVLVVQWCAAKGFSHGRPGDPRILWWTSRFELRIARRQLRRLLRELDIDPHEPIGVLRIEQWAAINAAMVTLVDPARWPRRKPRRLKALPPPTRGGRGR